MWRGIDLHLLTNCLVSCGLVSGLSNHVDFKAAAKLCMMFIQHVLCASFGFIALQEKSDQSVELLPGNVQ